MLRVLARDVKSSHKYSSGYYNKRMGATGNHSRFVTITGRAAPNNSDGDLHKLGDDRSGRSIVGNKGLELQGKNGIVHITDSTIKYEETGSAEGTD
jgi:hypothetical protein